MESKDVAKEIHHANMHQVAAMLTLAEIQLIATGKSQEEARTQIEDTFEFWESRSREDESRLTRVSPRR